MVLNTGACFTCGATGTFTKNKSGNGCTCSKTEGVWNADDGVCDCGEGKAMIVTGSNRVCITCDDSINAIGKADYKSCNCISSSLNWNPVSKACLCDSTSYFAFGECN